MGEVRSEGLDDSDVQGRSPRVVAVPDVTYPQHPLEDRPRVLPVKGNGNALGDIERGRGGVNVGRRGDAAGNGANDSSGSRAPSPAMRFHDHGDEVEARLGAGLRRWEVRPRGFEVPF